MGIGNARRILVWPAVLAGMIWIAVSSAAFACQPHPDDDDIETPDAALYIAVVRQVAVYVNDSQQACLDIEYDIQSTINGLNVEFFTVPYCTNLNSIQELETELSSETGSLFGFVAGSEVIVGVMRDDGPNGAVRFAVPSCFGPLVMRIDIMDPDERDALLEEMHDAWRSR